MIETGTIYKINAKDIATVRFSRKTACENCRMCFKPKDEMYVELTVKNTLEGKVGDKVSVSMGQQIVLVSSFIVYLIPVFLAAVALIATKNLQEMVSLGVTIGILVIYFIFVAFIDKWIKNNKNYAPEMVEIIKQEDK